MFLDYIAQNIDQVFCRKAEKNSLELLSSWKPIKNINFSESAVILGYVSWGYDTPEVRKHLYVQYRWVGEPV